MSSEWNRTAARIYRGFEDVQDWMQGQGRTADVHRVEDMIRVPLGLRAGSGEAFADILLTVVKGCVVQRRIDRTGKQPPSGGEEIDLWVSRFSEKDRAAAVWMHNVETLLAQAQGKRGGHLECIPILPECGVYCPRRAWDVLMMGKTPKGKLDSRAAAEIMGFLRLIEQLSDGEAQYVRAFLHRRLDSSQSRLSIPKALVTRARDGLLKMRDLATIQELGVLFDRAFLPLPKTEKA